MKMDIHVQFDELYCTEDYLQNVLEYRFCFNGECYQLSDTRDWLVNPSQDVEWHILLHKFYYAPGLARHYLHSGEDVFRDCLISLIDGWIQTTPVGFIAADVTARRIQNWVYAWCLLDKGQAAVTPPGFVDRMLDSLVAQTDYVLENLASSRNHRTLELYAIFLMSIVFPDRDIDSRWRMTSVNGLVDNISTDLLDDGVHCELSSDYHHIVLRSYLLFARLARQAGIVLPESTHARIQAALDFAMHLHRPDGLIPALSDSDSGDYRYLLGWSAELYGRDDHRFVATDGKAGSPPEQQCRVFEDGGYAVLRSSWQSDEPYTNARYLVFDAGPVGEGNHGHLDALSMEVFAYGRPLLVDPGRYTYDEKGAINWRARFRGTAAHNTVLVDGKDQAIYRQGPKRRKVDLPHPEMILNNTGVDKSVPFLHGVVKSPCYDAIHHRHIWFVDERYWVLVDRLQADISHLYEQRWQLTPVARNHVHVGACAGAVSIASPGMKMVVAAQGLEAVVEPGQVSFSYGIRQQAPRIVCSSRAASLAFVTIIFPENGANAQIQPRCHGELSEIVLQHRGCRHQWTWHAEDECLEWHDGIRAQVMMKGGCHVAA